MAQQIKHHFLIEFTVRIKIISFWATPRTNENCCYNLASMVYPLYPSSELLYSSRYNRPTAEENNGRILLQDIEWKKRRIACTLRQDLRWGRDSASLLFYAPRWIQRETTNLNQLKFNPEPRSRGNLPPCPHFSSFCSVPLSPLFLPSFSFALVLPHLWNTLVGNVEIATTFATALKGRNSKMIPRMLF